MEIKIATTKKKLTKSIISQMEVIGLEYFFKNKWRSLGFIMNARKDMNRLALVERDGDYAVFPLTYSSHYEKYIIRYYRRTSYRCDYETEEERDIMWNKYCDMKDSLTQIYI